MFICEECARKRKIDSFHFVVSPISYGNCELCKKTASCFDIHHSKLTNKETASQDIQPKDCN